MSGETLWLSGTDNEGFDIVLSQSTKSKVNNVLKSCGDDSSKCINGIFDTLQDAQVQLDTKLDRRNFGHMLSKTVKVGLKSAVQSGWAFFVGVSSLLYTNAKLRAQDNLEADGAYYPVNIASIAAKQIGAAQTAATKNLVLSASGSAVATITAPPDRPATLTGYVIYTSSFKFPTYKCS